MAASASTVGAVDSVSGASGGSRAAELRAAKMQMKAMQQQQQQQQEGGEDPSTASAMGPGPSPFGEAPKGYIPGSGRGAGSKKDDDDAGPTGYDTFGGYNDKLFDATTPYDDDDEEADRIYGEIDDRMSGIKRRRGQKDRTSGGGDGGDDDGAGGGAKIGDQFRQLKEKLADVTEGRLFFFLVVVFLSKVMIFLYSFLTLMLCYNKHDLTRIDQWASIPDVGDYR